MDRIESIALAVVLSAAVVVLILDLFYWST